MIVQSKFKLQVCWEFIQISYQSYFVILYVQGESSTAVSISEQTQNFSTKTGMHRGMQISPLLYGDWMISPAFIFL